jgi:general secretion pathway protein D
MKCICWCLVLLIGPVWAADDLRTQAQNVYQLARKTEAAGDSLSAFFLYGRAAKLDPNNAIYVMQQSSVQGRLQQGALVTSVLDPLLESMSPEDRMATRIAIEQLTPSEVIEGDPAREPLRLKPSKERRSFDLRGTPRPIIEEVLKAFGIDPIFEADFQAPGAAAFRVENISRDEAMHTLELIGNCFFVPVLDNKVLVFRDTTDKRNNNAPAMAAVIPISDRMNVQEAQELASGVQQILEIRHIAVDAGRRLIFLRDQEYKVLAARRLVADLMRLRAQVVVEVELMSVASHSDLSYGMSLQNTFNILASVNPVRLSALPTIATGWFGLALQDAAAFANMSRSATEASLKSEMRALDGQQVQLHIGDRYPVITGLSGFGDTSVPTTQFQELGLNLTITPVVHDGDVTLTIEADYNVLAGGSNNGIPIISGRKFSGTVQVPYGQWAVIGSLKKLEDNTVVNGIAGLGDIPGVGHLFRKDSVIKDRSEIMLVLKPHLVGEPGFRRPTSSVWMGTETKPPTFY